MTDHGLDIYKLLMTGYFRTMGLRDMIDPRMFIDEKTRVEALEMQGRLDGYMFMMSEIEQFLSKKYSDRQLNKTTKEAEKEALKQLNEIAKRRNKIKGPRFGK